MHCLIIPCGSRALVLLEQKEAYAGGALLIRVVVWLNIHFHCSQACRPGVEPLSLRKSAPIGCRWVTA